LNQKYPHGLGKVGARDHTTGTPPVTTFHRSTRLYNLAMSYNRGLDRDKDGIACEKL
jgi:Excalibur calcium-binding domain